MMKHFDRMALKRMSRMVFIKLLLVSFNGTRKIILDARAGEARYEKSLSSRNIKRRTIYVIRL